MDELDKHSKGKSQGDNQDVVEATSVVNPEEKEALEIAPPEIWSSIFEWLKNDSKSLSICYKTCKVWESVLANQRTSFLFDQIFPLLQNYFEPEDFEKVIPTCRLVSQEWKKVVDHFVQENTEFMHTIDIRSPEYFFHRSYVPNGWNFNGRFINVPKNSQEQIPQIQEFLNGVPASSADTDLLTIPVIPEEGVNENEAENLNLIMWMLKSFFPKFGYKIHSGNFHFSRNFDPSLIKIMVLAALKNLPNLKVLTVSCDHDHLEEDYVSEDCRKTIATLGINENTEIPKLQHLTTLNFTSCPPALIPELIPISENIVQFNCISFWQDWEFDNDQIEQDSIQKVEEKLSKLVKLTRLCLPVWYNHFNYLLSGLPRIENLPLQTLIVLGSKYAEELIKLTAHFKSTLQTLQFVALVEAVPIPAQFDLPHLETLRIEFSGVVGNPNSIDFICSLPSLKNLGVITSGHITNELETIIAFPSCYDRLYESNVWEVMPTLQNIFVQRDSTVYAGTKNSWKYCRSLWEK